MAEAPGVMRYNLGHYAKEWFTSRPDVTALVTMSREGTLEYTNYRQLYADVLSWAKFLVEKGVKTGDRVVMISPKSTRHFDFFYACWHIGAIAVPVCESLGDLEMGFILRDCDPTVILADKAYTRKANANAGNIPVISLEDMPGGSASSPVLSAPSEVGLDAVAVLIYTSGSTGMPKGVMLTHKNLWVNAYWDLAGYGMNDNDRLISLLPYWHSYALVCEIICSMMAVSTCVVPRDIRDFKKHLKIYQPTLMIAVPRVVEAMKQGIDKVIAAQPPKKKALIDKAIYNASRIFTAGPRLDGGILRMLTHHTFYDPLVFRKFRAAFGGKLRCIIVGGAPMDLELQIFFKYMGVMTLVGYGLTEASPVVCANRAETHKLGTCGKVFQWLLPEYGGDFTFKDEDGKLGKELRGQLLLKGDCVMKGYWRHKDASAKTFEDGWLNTGDVGYCDKEGFMTIQGRKGNMIVLIGGEKLHPEYVEDVVKASPYISEAMVIGENCKNVYVCVNVDRDSVKGKSDEEIYRLVKDDVHRLTSNLAAFQKPRDILILPEFNMENGTLTATLKIRRFKINELFRKEIEAFLVSNGEEIATKHEVGIASSKVLESLANDTSGYDSSGK